MKVTRSTTESLTTREKKGNIESPTLKEKKGKTKDPTLKPRKENTASPILKEKKGKKGAPISKQSKGKSTSLQVQEIQCFKWLKITTLSYKEDSEDDQSDSDIHNRKPSQKQHQSSKYDNDTNSTASNSIDESPKARTPLPRKVVFDPFAKAAWEEGGDWRSSGAIDY